MFLFLVESTGGLDWGGDGAHAGAAITCRSVAAASVSVGLHMRPGASSAGAREVASDVPSGSMPPGELIRHKLAVLPAVPGGTLGMIHRSWARGNAMLEIT